MVQQVQGTVVATREPVVQRTNLNEQTSIQVAAANRIISNSTTVVGTRNPTPSGGDPGGGRDRDPRPAPGRPAGDDR